MIIKAFVAPVLNNFWFLFFVENFHYHNDHFMKILKLCRFSFFLMVDILLVQNKTAQNKSTKSNKSTKFFLFHLIVQLSSKTYKCAWH